MVSLRGTGDASAYTVPAVAQPHMKRSHYFAGPPEGESPRKIPRMDSMGLGQNPGMTSAEASRAMATLADFFSYDTLQQEDAGVTLATMSDIHMPPGWGMQQNRMGYMAPTQSVGFPSRMQPQQQQHQQSFPQLAPTKPPAKPRAKKAAAAAGAGAANAANVLAMGAGMGAAGLAGMGGLAMSGIPGMMAMGMAGMGMQGMGMPVMAGNMPGAKTEPAPKKPRARKKSAGASSAATSAAHPMAKSGVVPEPSSARARVAKPRRKPAEPRPPRERTPRKPKPAETDEEFMARRLPDLIAPDLNLLFVGINPGKASATAGHHYAGVNNHFWRCLSKSGILGINRTVSHLDDATLLADSIGFTNICARPSKGENDLNRLEIEDGAIELRRKIETYRPKLVCFVGKGIYEAYTGQRCDSLGLQPPMLGDPEGTRFFVMVSTSGRVVTHDFRAKLELFQMLAAALVEVVGLPEGVAESDLLIDADALLEGVVPKDPSDESDEHDGMDAEHEGVNEGDVHDAEMHGDDGAAEAEAEGSADGDVDGADVGSSERDDREAAGQDAAEGHDAAMDHVEHEAPAESERQEHADKEVGSAGHHEEPAGESELPGQSEQHESQAAQEDRDPGQLDEPTQHETHGHEQQDVAEEQEATRPLAVDAPHEGFREESERGESAEANPSENAGDDQQHGQPVEEDASGREGLHEEPGQEGHYGASSDSQGGLQEEPYSEGQQSASAQGDAHAEPGPEEATGRDESERCTGFEYEDPPPRVEVDDRGQLRGGEGVREGVVQSDAPLS